MLHCAPAAYESHKTRPPKPVMKPHYKATRKPLVSLPPSRFTKMDRTPRRFSAKILFISLFLFLNAVNGVNDEELQDMISALRSAGYNLFGNAVMTSDLQDDILAGRSFTFFVPTDSSLFALNLRSSADRYLQTLRCHVVPSSDLSASTLRSLPPPGSFLPTLLHHRTLFLASRDAYFFPGSRIPTVDGVVIVSPGLFYGPNIAVHGLGGILSTRSLAGVLRSARSPVLLANHTDRAAQPEIQPPLPAIQSPSSPVSGSPKSAGYLAAPPELMELTPAGAPSAIRSPYSSMPLPPETAATPAPSSFAAGGPLPPVEEETSPAPAPGIRKQPVSWPETGEEGEGLSHVGMQRGKPHPRHLRVDSRSDFF